MADSTPSQRWSLFCGVGCLVFAGLTAATYGVASAPLGSRGTYYIGLHFALTAVAGLTWLAARRGSRAAARGVIWTGIGVRLLLVPAPSFTSHDVERYLWDGRVALEGLDPYRTAPDDPSVAELRAAWPTPDEHASYPTLYPPLALALFAVSAAFGPSPLLWKLVAALASIAALLFIAALMYRRDDLRDVAVIALCPLFILEGGVGGHVDVLAAAAVAAALWAIGHHRAGLTGFAIGAGVLSKLSPAVLVAAWARAFHRRWLLAAAATVALGYGAAVAIGLRPIGSLGVFVDKWRFGSPLFELAFRFEVNEPVDLFALLGILGLVGFAWRSRASDPYATRGFWALAWLLVLSPVVFPWYLLPLVPLLALSPNALGLLWISLHPLTYEVLDRFDATGTWKPATWPLGVLVVGWIAGALLMRVKRTR